MGVTPDQCAALRTLIEHGDLMQRELAVLPVAEREKFLELLEQIADACQPEVTKIL